jgi:hypothetical protein
MAAAVEELEKLEDTDAITQAQLRDALDAAAPKAARATGSRRNARRRLKAELIEAGKLAEPRRRVPADPGLSHGHRVGKPCRRW